MMSIILSNGQPGDGRMARYATDQREKTHDALLTIASAMLLESGFDGVSIGKVMQAAGLTHGGFYAHFDDRSALVKAALERSLAPSVARFADFAKEAKASGNPADLTRRYLSEHNTANVGGGCAAAALASEIPRQPATVRAAFIAGCAQAAVALGSALPTPVKTMACQPETAEAEADGSGAGGTAQEANPAWGLFAMMFGALTLMRACPDEASRAAIRARVTADVRLLAVQRSE
jgi:TetR/AcrR family transcriptional regulator, transcriptional repressor for nem operon